MVNLIMGLKGTGKTKRLVDMVKKAVAEESGDVVCIEKNRNLTYDIPYTARLVFASDYDIGTYDFMKGFISGLHAGNYDITHVFIDNLFKMLDGNDNDAIGDFLDWLSVFGQRENVKFTICATLDPDAVGDNIKKYAV